MTSGRPSRASGGAALLLAALLLAAAAPRAAAIEFDMVFQTKCVFEEVVDEEEAVSGRYEAFIRDRPDEKVSLSLRIESPLGELVFEKRDATNAEFTIEHPVEGEYRLCFTAQSKLFRAKFHYFYFIRLLIISFTLLPTDYQLAQQTRISFKWVEGVEAKDWSAVAKKDNLDSVHTELLRLEDAVHSIHLELQHIRRKEEQMRDVNELTNARVAWCSITALIICVATAVLQVYNLRKFLIRKKVL